MKYVGVFCVSKETKELVFQYCGKEPRFDPTETWEEKVARLDGTDDGVGGFFVLVEIVTGD